MKDFFTPAALRRFVRSHRISLGVIAALILIYTLVGFLWVPRFARSSIEEFATQSLHRKVSIGDIRFNPFTLTARVSKFALQESDGSELLRFSELRVNATLGSIWRRGVDLQEVFLADPDVDVVLNADGSVNLGKLIPPSKEPQPESKSKPLRVLIKQLEVQRGRVSFEDRTHGEPFKATIAPIEFKLSDFRTDAGHENAYAFAGSTQAGEKLSWAGDFTVTPVGSGGTFSIDGLKATTIDSYLGDALATELKQGTLSLQGRYQLKLDPKLQLDISLPTLAIRDLQLAERGTANTPVSIPAIDIHEAAFAWPQRTVSLQEVTVNKPHVQVVRDANGSINLARLAAQHSNAAPAPAAAPTVTMNNPAAVAPANGASDSAWHITVAKARVDAMAIEAEDQSLTPAAQMKIDPLNIEVTGYSTDAGTKPQLDMDLVLNDSGKVSVHGTAGLQPVDAKFAVEISDIALQALQPYISAQTAMTLHSGKLSGKGNIVYTAQADKPAHLQFGGDVRVADLATTDNILNQKFINWHELELQGIDFQLQPDHLNIERIKALDPYARVIIQKDRTLNVAHVLNPGGVTPPPPASDDDADDEAGDKKTGDEKTAGPPTPPKPEKPAPATKPFPTRIKLIEVSGGAARFADYSVEPSFSTGIVKMNGSISGLSSDPASRAKVKLEGKVDRYAPVTIDGNVNLLAATKYTDISMKFRNMELTTFNPYSGKFAGYNIVKGKLSTELKYLVQDRKLEAQHHIVIDNLEFGGKTESKDAVSLPVKLAVALLKDRNGVIDLNLPVNGSLDDPKFRIGPIIWKLFTGLLKKVATAPFALLGSLFGGSGEELSYIDFPAGSAQIVTSEQDKIGKLTQALTQRPQLKLDVPLAMVKDADADAMAREALAARVPATPTSDDSAKKKRISALEAAYKAQMKTSAPKAEGDGKDLDARIAQLESALLDQLKPDADALDKLARQRAHAVQAGVLADQQIDPERVFITSERQAASSEGKVRMTLQLQ